MKYKFLFDNLKANDLVEMYNGETTVFATVTNVHCTCNPKAWAEHFHLDSYICEYDKVHFSHSERVRSIWRYQDKNTLKRIAIKHPKTKIWEVNENMLYTQAEIENYDNLELNKAIMILQKMLKK